MASKLLLASSSLLLLLLLSNIDIGKAAFFSTFNLKTLRRKGLNSHEEARVGAPTRRTHGVNNIPCSWHTLFHVLPKGVPVPPSGPSRRHNQIEQCVGCVNSASSDNDVFQTQPSRN